MICQSRERKQPLPMKNEKMDSRKEKEPLETRAVCSFFFSQ
jgi:hypothetical protein